MWSAKAVGVLLCQLYCLVVLLTCTLELKARAAADGQSVQCLKVTNTLQTNLSVLQPCVHGSAGTPVVLDGSRLFGPSEGGARQYLDLAYKSSIFLLPHDAVMEIQATNISGVRMAKPSTSLLQLLLAMSVQPTASLRLTNVTLETDCATLVQYQEWVTTVQPANLNLEKSTGNIFAAFWRLASNSSLMVETVLSNCTITCRRPPAKVPAQSAMQNIMGVDSSGSTIVTVLTDVELYNALALSSAGAYGNGSVIVAVARDLVLTSPIWATQGVTVQRNVSIIGEDSSNCSSNTMIAGSSSERGCEHLRPTLDLQDLVSGVYIVNNAVVMLSNLTIINTGMVFGYAPTRFTGLGFVAPFLWFFDFTRIASRVRVPNQLVVIDCDIISYANDVMHIRVWIYFISAKFEPIASQGAAFSIGVHEIEVPSNQNGTYEFTRLDAYGMSYQRTTLVPSNLTNVTLTARSTGAPLYELLIPESTTAVPVWTHSDLQTALAQVQRAPCSTYSNVTLYVHLFSNISLDSVKWPSAGYTMSCNIVISGSIGRSGGTWLNFNLLSSFINLSQGAWLTFRFLTLINMPSQTATYSLGNISTMTLPVWPVGRPSSGSSYLYLTDCTLVIPIQEYVLLTQVVDETYIWPGLKQSMFRVLPDTSNGILLQDFRSPCMMLSNTLILNFSGNSAFPALLGPTVYGEGTGWSPPLSSQLMPTQPRAASTSAGSSAASSGVTAIAVAVPIGVVSLVVLAVVAVFSVRHRRACGDGNSGISRPAEDDSPEVPSMAPDSGTRGVMYNDSKGDGVVVSAQGSCLGALSSNNSPHSEDGSGVIGEGEQEASAKGSESESAPPLHVELHQLILDFSREIEDQHLTIHEALGVGGFATVYRGTWRGIDVAVKVIEFQDRVVGNERMQARAMTEAAIAANIQHINIVNTYSYDIRPVVPNEGSDQDTPSSTLLGIGPALERKSQAVAGGALLNPRRRSGSSDNGSGSLATRMWKLYLIQEFCEVGSLRMALENRLFQLLDGTPDMPAILRLLLDVVRGLQHLHKKNIVHGDLTPGNILLKANVCRPGYYVSKLADFGLSVKMNPSQTSVDNNRTGTPFYASPEVRQHGNLTKASDLFALGVVMWEMWHGRPCYQRVRGVKHHMYSTGFPSFAGNCPPTYADLATRCLRRTLEERPGLDEVHDVLRKLLGSAISSALSSGPSEGDTSGSQSKEGAFVPNVGGGGGGIAGGTALLAAMPTLQPQQPLLRGRGESPAAEAAAVAAQPWQGCRLGTVQVGYGRVEAGIAPAVVVFHPGQAADGSTGWRVDHHNAPADVRPRVHLPRHGVPDGAGSYPARNDGSNGLNSPVVPSQSPRAAPAVLPQDGSGADVGSSEAVSCQQFVTQGDMEPQERHLSLAVATCGDDDTTVAAGLQLPGLPSAVVPYTTDQSSISLMLGTVDEHFVTAVGSDG